MSKNKDYRKFYNKPKKEETVNESIVKPQTKEIHAAEETQEERYCEAPAEEQEVEELKIRKAKVVGAARVNVRQHPGKDAKVLTVLSENAEVEMLNNSNPGWNKVKTPSGAIGYMMSQFLKEI